MRQREGGQLGVAVAGFRYTFLFNVVQCYFMHIIPMAVILKIYSFDHRKVREEDELIPRSDKEAQSVSNSISN